MYVFYRFQLGRETYCGCWLYCHPLDWPSSSEIVLPWWQHLQVRCFEYCLPWKVIWRLIIKNTFTVIRNTQLIGEKFHQHTVKGNILCIDVLNNLKVAHYTVFREMFAPNFFFCLFHPTCHWANFMSGQIQNKSLITKSIRKRIYHTFRCLGKFNTGWNCFSNVQGRKKRQSENNSWYSILLV